jgi:hypothetical protein
MQGKSLDLPHHFEAHRVPVLMLYDSCPFSGW